MGMQGNFEGTVVAQDPGNLFAPNPKEGLYLLTKEGKLLALVKASMATQMPVDMLHRQSRGLFEAYLGKTIMVQGYLSGSTIYSAMII